MYCTETRWRGEEGVVIGRGVRLWRGDEEGGCIEGREAGWYNEHGLVGERGMVG